MVIESVSLADAVETGLRPSARHSIIVSDATLTGSNATL